MSASASASPATGTSPSPWKSAVGVSVPSPSSSPCWLVPCNVCFARIGVIRRLEFLGVVEACPPPSLEGSLVRLLLPLVQIRRLLALLLLLLLLG